MESPGTFPESPMDQDDVVYPCKGCGEILEEGKAFELAGNRWHIDCFRCNTCGTLLDSDANLLLLGDGSLICNNCTYSCNACGNKIEDLAILTGDQAFCASCFRCRNCKRKIENLRYARTSQGIFCMSCHESLMARRRKKSKAARQPAASSSGGAPVILDKSLPALPPNALPQSAFTPTPDAETPPSENYSETPTDVSPRPTATRSRTDGSLRNTRRDESPASLDESRKGTLRKSRGQLFGADLAIENLTLPASTYKANRYSHISRESDLSLTNGGDDGLFVPLALDPNPAPAPTPLANSRKVNDAGPDQSTPRVTDVKKSDRDYFNRTKLPSGSHREGLKENRSGSSREPSTERERGKPHTSPHIAYQEKGRQASTDLKDLTRKRKDPNAPLSPIFNEKSRSRHSPSPSQVANQTTPSDFKLQDVPKSKKSASRTSSKSDARSPSVGSPVVGLASPPMSPPSESTATDSPKGLESSQATVGAQRQREESPPTPQQQQVERPKRDDSLKQAMQRKEVASNSSPSTPTAPTNLAHERKASTTSARAAREGSSNLSQLNGGITITRPVASPTSKSMLDVPNPPSRSTNRPSQPNATATPDPFAAPRAPPPLPPLSAGERHKPSESISTIQSDTSRPMSPAGPLPRYSAGGDFSMEEDMARIMRGEDMGDRDHSVIRRVSNAVAKHSRSLSDRAARSSQHQKWRSPYSSSIDISSPTLASPGREEDMILVRSQLRRAQQRIAELEAEKLGLQEMVNGSADIKQVNVELREKRSTMAFLDTQREMVVRELEIMTEQLKKAKESNEPLNINSLQSEITRRFAAELQKLKDNMGGQIEELMQRRNALTNEIADLIQMKDKGFQEYESLSTRNSELSTRNNQLTHLNNELVESIREHMKPQAGRQANGSFDGGQAPVNGLGIYSHHHKEKSDLSMDNMRSALAQDTSLSHLLQDVDPDGHTVLPAPQVVNIRKGKPNMWKKGSQAVAKNIKGIKGAFASTDRAGHYPIEGTPYGSLLPASEISTPTSGPKSAVDPSRQGFGAMFAAQKGGSNNNNNNNNGNALKAPQLKNLQNANNSNTNLAATAGLDPSVLFGSDLTARCDYEKRTIPAIVVRCVQEVEARGMTVEGVYRKSGGSGQVNAVRAGFEKESNNSNGDSNGNGSGGFDISDEDLDIHAVTSALKQYFRRLPTPLITFDVYDRLLEAGQVKDAEKRAQALRMAVAELPRCHRDCLEFLVGHLARVVGEESKNLMTPHNLAVVFAPTIMRPSSIEREMTDMLAQRIAVQALLENSKAVFAE